MEERSRDILLDWKAPLPEEDRSKIEGVIGDLFQYGKIVRAELVELPEEENRVCLFSLTVSSSEDVMDFYRHVSEVENRQTIQWRFPNTMVGNEDAAKRSSTETVLLVATRQ